MTRSELIEILAQKQHHLAASDLGYAVKSLLEHLTETLATGERIEICGFGTFSLNRISGRMGRNPQTGEPVAIPERYAIRFKPGKDLRERVNSGVAKLS